MEFKCKPCGEKVSGSKMIGLVIGQIGRSKADNMGVQGFSKQDLLAGIMSGFKVSCPNCGKCNWE